MIHFSYVNQQRCTESGMNAACCFVHYLKDLKKLRDEKRKDDQNMQFQAVFSLSKKIAFKLVVRKKELRQDDCRSSFFCLKTFKSFYSTVTDLAKFRGYPRHALVAMLQSKPTVA